MATLLMAKLSPSILLWTNGTFTRRSCSSTSHQMALLTPINSLVSCITYDFKLCVLFKFFVLAKFLMQACSGHLKLRVLTLETDWYCRITTSIDCQEM